MCFEIVTFLTDPGSILPPSLKAIFSLYCFGSLFNDRAQAQVGARADILVKLVSCQD